MDLHHQLPLVLGLLLVVTLLSLAARRIHMPYPTVMVLGGLAIGFIPNLPPIHLDPDAVFLLFLPPLLYAGAWQTSWRDFKANLGAISLMAVGFVLFTTVAVAWVAHGLIPEMNWATAFTLGAIISPPDAIAATAILNRMGIPRRVVTILEGESLVNDATGLTIYRFAIAAVVTGGFSLASATLLFICVSAGGIILGLLLGLLIAQVHKRLDDPLVETVFTLVTPFAAYLIAEKIGVSGVLTVVAAGLYLSRRSHHLFSHNTRITAGAVWAVFTFLLNGMVFILIGLELPTILSQHLKHTLPQALGYAIFFSLVVVLIRLLWVFPTAYLYRLPIPFIQRRWPRRPSWQNVFIVAYAGMRGVDSLAAALAIPLVTSAGAPFPHRNLIIFLTFGVILFTLVVQSLSLPALIRVLRIKTEQEPSHEEEEARLRACQAAVAHLDQLAAIPGLHAAALECLRRHYDERIRLLTRRYVETTPGGDGKNKIDLIDSVHQLRRSLIEVERQHLVTLRDRNLIRDEVLHNIERDLDLDEARLL